MIPVLTETERRQMLAEIATVALMIGRDLFPESELSDGDVSMGVGENGDVCPRERVAFVAEMWPRLENALRRIEAAPDSELRPTTRIVPTERARRVLPKDLLMALRRHSPTEGNRPGFAVADPLFAATRPVFPRTVAECTTEPVFDTPANRLVKSFLVTLTVDMKTAAELATVSAVPTVAAEAWRLQRRIRNALRRIPSGETTSNVISPGQTLPQENLSYGGRAERVPVLPLRVRHNGAYRFLWDSGRRYRAGFSLNWHNPIFTLPTRENWLLYEYWCLFQAVKALKQLGFRAISGEDFVLSRSGLTFTLVKGRPSALTFLHATGQTITLWYSRLFPADMPDHDGFSSRSHAMRPDIVLSKGEGTAPTLLVLDAKFKTYRTPAVTEEKDGGEGDENLPLTADINQCHAYRDGIVRDDVPVVEAAWLLYAGASGQKNQAVIAYRRPDVGALLLRPGSSLKPLLERLRTWAGIAASDSEHY